MSRDLLLSHTNEPKMQVRVKCLICVVTAVCCYSLFEDLLQYSYVTDNLFRSAINATCYHDRTSSEGGAYMPPISTYRQRFLLWYYAMPDIAALIGPDTGAEAGTYLIYRCDRARLSACGGWADRIKNIVAAYIIANLTGRNLKAEMLSKGCGLTEYLTPHLVDWRLPTSFHSSLLKPPNDMAIINIMASKLLAKAFSAINFTKLIGTKRFVYFRTNMYHNKGFKASTVYEHELSWMKSLTHDQVMATVYKRLFVLHPRLHSRLQSFLVQTLPSPQHKLICVHVRMGENPTIPRDTEVRNSPKNLFRVWEFIKEHSKTDLDKVFLMTDSTQTIAEAHNQSFKTRIVETQGPILHLEFSSHATDSDMCKAEEKIVFDQHVLMNCDVLMISKSGLSRLAAYVRGSDTGLYCFLKSGMIVPCRTQDIVSLYNIIVT